MSIKDNITKFNDMVAVTLTDTVGTMWCAYAFALLALISLPDAIHAGLAATISWIAQTFLQLVLLSVIMVGQEVQARKTEARSQQDHETILAEFAEIKAMHVELTSLHEDKAGCGYVEQKQ